MLVDDSSTSWACQTLTTVPQAVLDSGRSRLVTESAGTQRSFSPDLFQLCTPQNSSRFIERSRPFSGS